MDAIVMQNTFALMSRPCYACCVCYVQDSSYFSEVILFFMVVHGVSGMWLPQALPCGKRFPQCLKPVEDDGFHPT